MSTENAEIQRSFEVGTPARLSLANIRGSVTLRRGAAGTVAVRAVKETGSGDAERTEIVIEQMPDGLVRVETRFPWDLLDWLLTLGKPQPCRVHYTVSLPNPCEAQVSVVSSSASIEGLDGEIAVKSVSGDVRVRDLAGALAVNTVSGEVSGQGVRLRGRLSVNTVSGNVHFERSALAEVRAKTVSGDVRLEAALGRGPYDFNSVSGNVYLTLPAGAACTISLHSVSGEIRTTLAARQHSHGFGQRRVEIGRGGPLIAVRSVSGDVVVDAGDEGTEAPAPEPQAEATPRPAQASSMHDRQAVLERLARGEITVDEAAVALKQ